MSSSAELGLSALDLVEVGPRGGVEGVDTHCDTQGISRDTRRCLAQEKESDTLVFATVCSLVCCNVTLHSTM